MRPAAWVPEPQEREVLRGPCSRSCCWRGPHGQCRPVDPKSCRCHSEAVSREARREMVARIEQRAKQVQVVRGLVAAQRRDER